jgi:hypothetical protein
VAVEGDVDGLRLEPDVRVPEVLEVPEPEDAVPSEREHRRDGLLGVQRAVGVDAVLGVVVGDPDGIGTGGGVLRDERADQGREQQDRGADHRHRPPQEPRHGHTVGEAGVASGRSGQNPAMQELA